MSKKIYSEICVHFGMDSVENLDANRRNRFINRYAEADAMWNVVLIRFACFVVFLLRLFNFSLLYLFSVPYKTAK